MSAGGQTSPIDAGSPVPTAEAAASTGASGRRRRPANHVPLVAVLGGAAATVLWGCDLLPGGWLGIDVALVAVGVMLARPSTRPRGFRTWRGPDGRIPVLRVATGTTVAVLAVIALGLATGRTSANSGVRGDLLAFALQYANLRGAGGAPHALDSWLAAPTSQLWLGSLLVQAAVVVIVVRTASAGRPSPARTQRAVAAAAAAASVAAGFWGTAHGWTVPAIVLGPWFRGVGLAFGFAAARWVRRPSPSLTVLWPAPIVVLAGLAVTASADETWAPVAVLAAVAATTALLLVRPVAIAPIERHGRQLTWVAAVAFLAGPALAALAASGADGSAADAAGVVLALGGAVAIGWAACTLEPRVPVGDLTRVVVPPLCVVLLFTSLALAGFFHAPAPKLVDPASHARPTGTWALAVVVDGMAAPASFCESPEVEALADYVGDLLVSIVDEDRATERLARSQPDWDQVAAAAPDPAIADDIAVVRDQTASLVPALGRVGPLIDAGDIAGLSKVIQTDPGVFSVLRLTFYLGRRCDLTVSS